MNKKIHYFILGIIFIIFLFGGLKILAQGLEVQYPHIPHATAPRSINTGLPQYLRYIYNFSILIAGVLVFTLIVWGGARYFFSFGNPGRMAEAKNQIINALLGLLVVFTSYMILNTLNPQLLIFNIPTLEKWHYAYIRTQPQVAAVVPYQEIPVGTLITSEVGVSSFLATSTASTTDPSVTSTNYLIAFSTTTDAYPTPFQGMLHGRRLKRIHEVASTTVPVAKKLAELSNKLLKILKPIKRIEEQLLVQ